MNVEYAKAYTKERMGRAEAKRQQRAAVMAYREARKTKPGPSLRNIVGGHFISLGHRLSGSNSPLPLAQKS